MKPKYPTQKCSYCKGVIYHPEDRLPERIKGECGCSNRGEYYIQSFIKYDMAGICYNSDFYEHGYRKTKLDQEHY